MKPVKPKSRQGRAGVIRFARGFRSDILSALPEKLYRAWMAELKTPFFKSIVTNDPALVKLVLKQRPLDFPKSDYLGDGLRPLLGESVFLINGPKWQRQRRIIDPAFEGGRLRHSYPLMYDAAQGLLDRLTTGPHEFEELASAYAADVIFRTLLSVPIVTEIAHDIFQEFRKHQAAQPIVNLGGILRLPRWMTRFYRPAARKSVRRIRALITELTRNRARAIADGTAPQDLATKIMTTPDPETGKCFDWDEMVDQVAIFFLAGHETSASAIGWALYLLVVHPEWQDRFCSERQMVSDDFSSLSELSQTRAVFRETLRLYPPVPMMVRETCQSENLRNRQYDRGLQAVISPWHLHRHQRLWDNPDGFDPDRWSTDNGRQCLRDVYIPFSAGPRVCPGAGFAMSEGVLALAMLVRQHRFELCPDRLPQPVARLTVRSKN
jgi:cytochrome P450